MKPLQSAQGEGYDFSPKNPPCGVWPDFSWKNRGSGQKPRRTFVAQQPDLAVHTARRGLSARRRRPQNAVARHDDRQEIGAAGLAAGLRRGSGDLGDLAIGASFAQGNGDHLARDVAGQAGSKGEGQVEPGERSGEIGGKLAQGFGDQRRAGAEVRAPVEASDMAVRLAQRNGAERGAMPCRMGDSPINARRLDMMGEITHPTPMPHRIARRCRGVCACPHPAEPASSAGISAPRRVRTPRPRPARRAGGTPRPALHPGSKTGPT